jgi:maleate cis-trans isomerase
MADIMRAAGVGPIIVFEGKEYQFSPITPVIIGRFEAWLENQGWEVVKRYSMTHSAAETARQEDAHRRDCATNVYGHGSDYFRMASVTLDGLKRVTRLCLQEGNNHDPDITADFTERLFTERTIEVKNALEAVGWVSFGGGNVSDSESDVAVE